MAAGSSDVGPDFVDRLLFPAPRSEYTSDDWPGELIWLPRGLSPTGGASEDHVPALLLLASSSKHFVLAMHSNGDDLGRFYWFCHRLRNTCSVHVLAVEYPGYGVAPGRQATSESVTENAMLGFRFLTETLSWPTEDIIILGRSVGCGPALQIASRHRVFGLCLVCPFRSVSQLARDYVGPLADLVTEKFPNEELVKRVTAPMLLIHGKKDFMVSWKHGEAMYDACVSRKQMVVPEFMWHNTNLHANPAYFVTPFLAFFPVLPPVYKEVRVPEWVFHRPARRRGDTPLRMPSCFSTGSCLGKTCGATGACVVGVGPAASDTIARDPSAKTAVGEMYDRTVGKLGAIPAIASGRTEQLTLRSRRRSRRMMGGCTPTRSRRAATYGRSMHLTRLHKVPRGGRGIPRSPSASRPAGDGCEWKVTAGDGEFRCGGSDIDDDRGGSGRRPLKASSPVWPAPRGDDPGGVDATCGGFAACGARLSQVHSGSVAV